MTDSKQVNVAPGDAAGSIEVAPFSVGTALREARVHHGLSVDEISNRLKFAPRQIEALEADDFAHLPETTFLRGFVRSYASLLQLDPAPLLAALPHAPGQSVSLEAKALTEVPYPNIYTERKQNIIWLAAALAVAVALALSAWLLGGKPKEPKGSGTSEITVSGAQNTTVETLTLPAALPVSAVPDMEPVAAIPNAEKPSAEKPSAEKPRTEKPSTEKPGAEKPGAEKLGTGKHNTEKPGIEMKKAAEVKNAPQIVTPAAPLVATPIAKPVVKSVAANNVSGKAAIRMTFDADSWVEIKDKDGKILLSQLNHAGIEQGINGSPPFTLTIGYAKAVHLYYKGKAVDLEQYANDEVAHLTLE